MTIPHAPGLARRERQGLTIASGLACIGLCAALLWSCAAVQPSLEPTATPGPTQNELTLLTPFPPRAVQDSLSDRLRIELEPLSDTERGQVAIGQADAIRTALSSRGVGNPGPDGVGEIEWTGIGFVYLGRYTPFNLPGYGGPRLDPTPFRAYLIQVLAPAIPDFPGENTALVIVDARSGALGTTYGPCVGGLCGPP